MLGRKSRTTCNLCYVKITKENTHKDCKAKDGLGRRCKKCVAKVAREKKESMIITRW